MTNNDNLLWKGRKITSKDHAKYLDTQASVHEFREYKTNEHGEEIDDSGKPIGEDKRTYSEHKAYTDYLKESQAKSAAHHLDRVNAAKAVGALDMARKHHASYVMALTAMGLDPMKEPPPEVKKHLLASNVNDKENFKYEPHEADSLLSHSFNKSEPNEMIGAINKALGSHFGKKEPIPLNPPKGPNPDRGEDAKVIPITRKFDRKFDEAFKDPRGYVKMNTKNPVIGRRLSDVAAPIKGGVATRTNPMFEKISPTKKKGIFQRIKDKVTGNTEEIQPSKADILKDLDDMCGTCFGLGKHELYPNTTSNWVTCNNCNGSGKKSK